MDFDCMTDLIWKIDSEGLEYFFCDYTNAENLTVAGFSLPIEVLEAAKELEKACGVLRKYFS